MYKTIRQLISIISSDNIKNSFLSILEDNPHMYIARGSKCKHQAWEGGYIDHVTEVMNLAINMYEQFMSYRPLPFLLKVL